MDIRGLTKMGMLRRSVPGVCARYAATNAYRAVSYSFAIGHSSGVLSGDISAYDAIASNHQAFKDYKRYSDWNDSSAPHLKSVTLKSPSLACSDLWRRSIGGQFSNIETALAIFISARTNGMHGDSFYRCS